MSSGFESLIIGVPDLNGILRAKTILAGELGPDLARPVCLSEILLVLDPVDAVIPRPPSYVGRWPTWESGFVDLIVTSTADAPRPSWRENVGVLLGCLTELDGTPVGACSRTVLRNVLRRFAALGLTVGVGTELEFVLLHEDGRGVPLSCDPAPYRVDGTVAGRSAVEDLGEHLTRMGIAPESTHPEWAPGQHELALAPAEPLEAADRVLLAKQATRHHAARSGLLATFMARPLTGFSGSGLHLNISLWEGDRNLCAAEAGSLPAAAASFVAGVVTALPELTCLLAPNINSYRRLVPGLAAGTSETWAPENRSVGVRTVERGAARSRIEIRAAGADANPYLAIAGVLAAGLDGVERELPAPPVTSGDAYGAAETRVPHTLDRAIARFESSRLLDDHLGSEFVRAFASTRRWELEQAAGAVTDWDLARYARSV